MLSAVALLLTLVTSAHAQAIGVEGMDIFEKGICQADASVLT